MIVGLTGGIGSGKTTVARIFEQLDVPVYYADDRSRQLLDTDKLLQQKLQDLLGTEVVKSGKIDRPLMASKIFGNKELLQQANALIHPAVAEDFASWYETQQSQYVIREAAILYESGSYKDCQYVVVVQAPEPLRIKRVIQRSQTTEEEVRRRMQNQWPQEEKIRRADYQVTNDGQHLLIKQIIAIHEDIIRRTNARG